MAPEVLICQPYRIPTGIVAPPTLGTWIHTAVKICVQIFYDCIHSFLLGEYRMELLTNILYMHATFYENTCMYVFRPVMKTEEGNYHWKASLPVAPRVCKKKKIHKCGE